MQLVLLGRERVRRFILPVGCPFPLDRHEGNGTPCLIKTSGSSIGVASLTAVTSGVLKSFWTKSVEGVSSRRLISLFCLFFFADLRLENERIPWAENCLTSFG